MTPGPRILWLFGLPSAGKTTLARAVAKSLREKGRTVCILDGDEMRSGVNADLGFSDTDRSENLRRSAHIAKLLAGQDMIVIAAFVTPKEANRELVHRILESTGVRLVHVDCPLDVCVDRDVKGLYAKATQKKMQGMTGLQDPFEAPQLVDLTIRTNAMSIEDSITKLLSLWPAN